MHFGQEGVSELCDENEIQMWMLKVLFSVTGTILPLEVLFAGTILG